MIGFRPINFLRSRRDKAPSANRVEGTRDGWAGK
jgi:hypothetical protein